MGLSMSQRRAVSRESAVRYRNANRSGKAKILDELCAVTGWHRDHARKALRTALVPRVVRPRAPRPPLYGEPVMVALRFCWAVLGAPAGKRLAPVLGELVARLSRLGELTVDDVTAALLSQMSAATIDRRLAPDRSKMQVRGRSHTKPGSLLKDSIPIRTWAEWDEARPGFVEIDLVGHEGGNAVGEHCYTLTVTDIATGWTENRSVKNKAQKWVFAALVEIREAFPFPILGIDSDNGSEFINWHLFRYCVQEKITFTRSRSGNSNDGAHVEQKNWAVVRAVVGYHRYDTTGELLLLNKIWLLQGLLTNFFYPQQKLLSKQRQGAKVIKKYDVATTPYSRATGRKEVTAAAKERLVGIDAELNPAALQRQVQALSSELLNLTTSKAAKRQKPQAPAPAGPTSPRASGSEATKGRRRAS
jgi:Integrase core domain.